MAETQQTRILIAASEFEPFTNIGNLGRVVQNLSVALNGIAVGAEIRDADQKSADVYNADHKTVDVRGADHKAIDVRGADHKAADVRGADHKAVDVRVALPNYANIPEKYKANAVPVCEFEASLGRRMYICTVSETVYKGVVVYLVSCGDYFERDQVYSSVVDDVERYSCFCNAVLGMLPRIEFSPDIIQCHDWQMSYIPTLYKTNRNRRSSDVDIKTLFVIHSMQYQGVCSRYDMLDLLDLPIEYFTPSTLEFYGQANSLKGGLIFSDRLVTVSPNYSREIQHAYYGENLEGIIRTRSSDINGVLCGIDAGIYNPAADDRIYYNYDAATADDNKPKNKLRLQKMLGFKQDRDIPLIIVISDELDYDKGVELIKFVFDEIVATGVQMIFASKGKSEYHDFFSSIADAHHDKVAYVRYNGGVVWDGAKWAGWEGFNGSDASKYPDALKLSKIDVLTETMLICGSDMLLRPSRIEPCGEKHLIALKYGTLPIVRETGGLKDVVVSYNSETGEGNGFSFFNYNAHDMLYTIKRAIDIFRNDRESWGKLIKAAMKVDITWEGAAEKYMNIYKTLTGTK